MRLGVAGEISLGEVAEIIMGQSPPGETYNDRKEGLPFFQGVADFNYRHPTPRVYCSTPSRIAHPGDILLSVRAPIGRSARVPHPRRPARCAAAKTDLRGIAGEGWGYRRQFQQ